MSEQFEIPEKYDQFETPEEPKAINPRGGPRTPEGKARSRFNAVRHGLTSQTAIFPWEEYPRYELLCQQMKEHYQPVGPMEDHLVQTMIDGIWKLNRANTAESSLFALYLHQHEGRLNPEDPEIEAALIKGLMYKEESQKLVNMSRYAQRVDTQVYQAQKRLEELQEKRKQREEEALLEAAALKAVHEKRPENKGIAYNPAEDKFVLKVDQINEWIRRQERRQMAGLKSKTIPAATNWGDKFAA